MMSVELLVTFLGMLLGSGLIQFFITRKDNKYGINEIEDALKDKEEVTIILGNNDVITKDMQEKIQKANKKLTFVRYGEEDKLLYTWIVDGPNLKSLGDFNTNITFSFEDENDFDEISGYRKGVYLQFAEKNHFPNGITCQINVENQFKNGEVVHLYSYNREKKKIQLIDEKLKVDNGKVDIFMNGFSQYFLTKASILEKEVTTSKDSYKIVAVVEFILLFVLLCVLLVTKKNKKAANNS